MGIRPRRWCVATVFTPVCCSGGGVDIARRPSGRFGSGELFAEYLRFYAAINTWERFEGTRPVRTAFANWRE